MYLPFKIDIYAFLFGLINKNYKNLKKKKEMEKEKVKQQVKTIGEYKVYLEQELGRGAYGIVYKAIKSADPSILFAIKMLTKKDLNPKIIERFEELISREIDVLKDLQHINIVHLDDVKVTSNNIYLIFEYCSSGSLKGFLDKGSRMTEKEVVKAVIDLLSGMEYYIKKKIIHRDLKPANILIGEGNQMKICDFGFGRFVQDVNQEAVMTYNVGSPLYLAPEVYKREEYNYKCDIWSLGIIFYEMLFGKTPWHGKSAPDLFTNNIMVKPLDFPDNIPVRKDIKQIIKKILTINQKDRIDIQELKEKLTVIEAELGR